MTALYSVLLIGVPIAIIATSAAIGVVGVRNYLEEVRGFVPGPAPVDREATGG